MVDSLGTPLGGAFQGIDFSAGRGNADTVGFAYAARTFPDGGPPDLAPDYIVKYGRSESGSAVAVDSLSLPQPGFPADELPAELPFMDRIDVTPGGHLWVRQPRTAQRQAWDIFDDRGRYLGLAFSEVPLDDYPLRVTGPRSAVGVRREAFGVEYVVRLELRSRDDSHALDSSGGPVLPPG